jgi:Ca-activated chloride channel family protein
MARRAPHGYYAFGRGYHPGRRWGELGRGELGRGELHVIPAIFLLLVPLQVRAQDSHPGEFRISTDVELVLLDVSVRDPKGGYVSGLAKEDFKIFENGAPQKITQFASADMPVTVGLVMDDSGSMRYKRPEVITAGLVFIGASNPLDQIFVINFNDRVRRGLPETVPFTDDINLLRAALSNNMPQGRTALYDAIAVALKHLESGRRDKKTLVVVSDGGDNVSAHSLKELMLLVQESRATIYTVGIFDSDDPDSNPRVLERIAKLSGGESFLPRELDQIIPICKKIAKDIRNRYTIGYTPVRTGDRGALRKIHVVATVPDRGKLLVRTRTSYLLPARSLGQSDRSEALK